MHPFHQRFIAVSLLASVAISSFAPAAFAGHGKGSYRKVRRFERPDCVERVNVYPQRVVEYRHRSSGGGSTLAGFLGGVAVGAIISSAAQSHASSHTVYARQPAYYPPQPAYCPPQPTYCPPPPRCDSDRDRYSYEDPYCRERFSSLSLFLSHARHGDHSLVVQVIDNRDEECVDVIRYRGDHWVSCDRNDRGDWDYDDND